MKGSNFQPDHESLSPQNISRRLWRNIPESSVIFGEFGMRVRVVAFLSVNKWLWELRNKVKRADETFFLMVLGDYVDPPPRFEQPTKNVK